MGKGISKGSWIVYKKLKERPWSERSEREKIEFMQKHQHDTRELFDYIEGELSEQYLNGEMTEKEYEDAVSGLLAEKDVREMKATKYEKIQQEYFDDDITEDELEERMDKLFESGDDFLNVHNESDEPESGGEFAPIIIGIAFVVLFIISIFLITKGLVIFPLIALAVAMAVSWFIG